MWGRWDSGLGTVLSRQCGPRCTVQLSSYGHCTIRNRSVSYITIHILHLVNTNVCLPVRLTHIDDLWVWHTNEITIKCVNQVNVILLVALCVNISLKTKTKILKLWSSTLTIGHNRSHIKLDIMTVWYFTYHLSK